MGLVCVTGVMGTATRPARRVRAVRDTSDIVSLLAGKRSANEYRTDVRGKWPFSSVLRVGVRQYRSFDSGASNYCEEQACGRASSTCSKRGKLLRTDRSRSRNSRGLSLIHISEPT